MTKRTFVSALLSAAVTAALTLVPGVAAGQAKTPYNPPKTPDGQPDIQGHYAPDAPNAQHSLEEGEDPENTLGRGQRTAAQLAEALKNRPVLIVDPEPGPHIPYQPAARAKQRQLLESEFAPLKITDIEPEDRCSLEGIPRSNYRGNIEIIQSPGQVTMLYTWNHAYRTIPVDGRQHPGAAIKLFNGNSVGRWEGNTLVVDVTNLNDLTWFDAHGTHHSDALHVVERWTIVDAKTINYEATMDDPKVFTRTWKIAYPMRRARGEEMYEEACVEGNDPTIEGELAVGRDLAAKGIKGRHEHTKGFYDEK